jgi:UDP-glucose 4-epimerase
VNVDSTRLLLDYSRLAGVTRFVLASSGSVYGGSASPLSEDQPLRPPDAYARSKSDAEALLEQAPADLGVCALRLFAPYGPGQNGRLIADLVGRVSSGRPVILRGGGHPWLNPVFVDDVAEIVVRSLESPVPPILNVAGDEVLSIRDMAETIGRVLGASPVFEEAPGEPPPDLVADTTLLRRTFGLGDLTSFERGIAATVG